MNFRITLVAVFVLLIALTPEKVLGSSVTIQESTFQLNGEITRGDYNELIRLMKENRGALIYPGNFELNSPGGSVLEALKLGELIHASGLTVHVSDSAECHSACFILLASAQTRFLLGTVTIHRPYFSSGSYKHGSREQLLREQNTAISEAAEYLRRLFVPDNLVQHMIGTSSKEAYKLNARDISQLGMHAPAMEELIIAQCDGDTNNFEDPAWRQCWLTELASMRFAYLAKLTSIQEAQVVVARAMIEHGLEPLADGFELAEDLDFSAISSIDNQFSEDIYEETEMRAKAFGLRFELPATEERYRDMQMLVAVLQELTKLKDPWATSQWAATLGEMAMHNEAQGNKELAQHFNKMSHDVFIQAFELGSEIAPTLIAMNYRYGGVVEENTILAYAYHLIALEIGGENASELEFDDISPADIVSAQNIKDLLMTKRITLD